MFKIDRSCLDSGIEVITETMPGVESSTIGFWVKTGSRDEAAAVGGVSHFIEHLLFKGTKRRSPLDISREIERVGGILNAFTGREFTCFYVKVLNKDIPLAIDLLSDILTESTFDETEIDKERQVVLQEIHMVDDTPDDLVHDLFAERFWNGHRIGSPTLGLSDTIKNIPRDKILEYFNKHYTSENMFITAAGGITHDEVLSHLGSGFKGNGNGAASGNDFGLPKQTSGIKIVEKDLEQVHICLGVPAMEQSNSDRYKLYLANNILGSGMSSRLFQKIREDRGLAYSVYSFLSLYRDAGMAGVYVGTTKEHFSESVEIILNEYNKMADDITEEELTDAKEQLKGGIILGLEASDSRMMKLARDFIYYGKSLPVSEIVEEIEKVSLSDAKGIVEEYFVPSRVTLVAVGNVEESALSNIL